MKGLLLGILLLLSGPVTADPFKQALTHAAVGEYSQAAADFHELARQGDLAAAHNLAILFSLGQGVPRSPSDAAYWAWRALLDGLDHAAPLAGLTMTELPLLERDMLSDRLDQHYAPRAAAGDGRAMMALAVVQAILRPEPDLLVAYGWQSIAAALDEPGAARAREETRNMMSDEMRSRASLHALGAFRDWCTTRGADSPRSCTVVMTTH